MIGLLIFYCLFSGFFCVGTVDETDYAKPIGAIASSIFSFFLGPILFPIILGETLMKIRRN